MTVTSSDTAPTELVGHDDQAAEPAERKRGRTLPAFPFGFGKRQVRRGLIAVATGAVTLLLAYWVCQSPLAHVWYQARQQNLAADYNAKRSHTKKGQALAVLQIPTLNLDLAVVEGDGPAELRGGPGHRIGSPLPGDVGNSLIFGHRKGWGGPFAKLDQLHAHDAIIVKKRSDALPLEFLVVSVTRTSGADARLLAPSTDHRLTLVSGVGGALSTDHLVVTAISGDTGKLQAAVHVRAGPLHEPLILNLTVGILVAAIVAACLTVWSFRRRHRAAMAAVVAVPLVLVAIVALFLQIDLQVLSPLR